jgi:hypothetical protein
VTEDPPEVDKPLTRDTHDPTDRDYHLRRVCASFDTTISAAGAKRLVELLGRDEDRERLAEQ